MFPCLAENVKKYLTGKTLTRDRKNCFRTGDNFWEIQLNEYETVPYFFNYLSQDIGLLVDFCRFTTCSYMMWS